jgi:hypothetical protein
MVIIDNWNRDRTIEEPNKEETIFKGTDTIKAVNLKDQ